MRLIVSKYLRTAIVIFIHLGFFLPGKAQNIIQGLIVDKITGKPIPYVSIGFNNGADGVITNSNGEFVIHVDHLPINLMFRHLSYKDTTFSTNSNIVKLELEEAKYQLQEIIVSNIGSKIMQSLYNKLMTNDSPFSASGFYRQTTTNNNICTELIETFNDITKSSHKKGLRYKIVNARYGVRKEDTNEAFLKFSNFSYLIFAIKPLAVSKHKDDGNSIGVPLMPNADLFYTYQVIGKILNGNEEILEIYCSPLFPERPYFEGSYFVNKSTLNLIRVQGVIKNHLGVNIDNLNSKIANVVYTIDMRFKSIGIKTVSDYMEVAMTSDFTNKKTNETVKAEIKGLLLMYNYRTNITNRSGKKVSIKTNDLEQVKNSSYDPKFWQNNPIIKRTILEENIIDNFERSKYFGTYQKSEK